MVARRPGSDASGWPAIGRVTRAAAAVIITRATSVMATRRWTVTTMACGPPTMRIRPMPAWTITTRTAARIGHKTPGSRSRRQATHAVTKIRSPATTAARRCEYSMSAWSSSGGSQPPKQRGQSGHASPEPVARTSPPIATRASVVAAVAAESLRRTVMERVATIAPAGAPEPSRYRGRKKR